MGRSVSTPSGAVAIAYRDVSYMEDDYDWDYFKDDIVNQLQSAFPSLSEADGWIGREDHIILENGHCQVTISEYCGLAAISLVPETHDCYYSEDIAKQNLADHWCHQVSDKFVELLSELNKVGTFSNGEAIFERRAS